MSGGASMSEVENVEIVLDPDQARNTIISGWQGPQPLDIIKLT